MPFIMSLADAAE